MKKIKIAMNFALNFVTSLRFVYSKNDKKKELIQEKYQKWQSHESFQMISRNILLLRKF